MTSSVCDEGIDRVWNTWDRFGLVKGSIVCGEVFEATRKREGLEDWKTNKIKRYIGV